MFYLTVNGIDGRGLYTPEGFVVLKGSKGNRAHSPSLGESNQRFRQRLLDGGVTREVADTVVFEKDHLFGSPSMAALALLGRRSNGWQEWKSEKGVTLHKVETCRSGGERRSLN